MNKKLEPLNYAKKIREATNDGDLEAVGKLEELYGKQEVNLKDIEELNAYTIQILGVNMLENNNRLEKALEALEIELIKERTLNSAKIDHLMELLSYADVIDSGDIDSINLEQANLTEEIDKGIEDTIKQLNEKE